MSGVPGSLNCSEFPADTVGKERSFSLHSPHSWPSHPDYRLLQSLRDKKTNALQLADTIPSPCLHAEKGRSVCLASLRLTCSAVVKYFKALQDEGLCKCRTVINVG